MQNNSNKIISTILTFTRKKCKYKCCVFKCTEYTLLTRFCKGQKSRQNSFLSKQLVKIQSISFCVRFSVISSRMRIGIGISRSLRHSLTFNILKFNPSDFFYINYPLTLHSRKFANFGYPSLKSC